MVIVFCLLVMAPQVAWMERVCAYVVEREGVGGKGKEEEDLWLPRPGCLLSHWLKML